MRNFLISKQGLEFIKRHEGVSRHVYFDVGGLPTIGVGHLLTKDELSSGIIVLNKNKSVNYHAGLNKQEVMLLLSKDLQSVRNCLIKLNKELSYSLQTHQIDALADFIFNVGVGAFNYSTLRKKLINNDLDGATLEFKRWNLVSGKVVQGLVNRRANEERLFTQGVYV